MNNQPSRNRSKSIRTTERPLNFCFRVYFCFFFFVNFFMPVHIKSRTGPDHSCRCCPCVCVRVCHTVFAAVFISECSRTALSNEVTVRRSSLVSRLSLRCRCYRPVWSRVRHFRVSEVVSDNTEAPLSTAKYVCERACVCVHMIATSVKTLVLSLVFLTRSVCGIINYRLWKDRWQLRLC